MPIYKVCKCPFCGAVQLSTAKKVFKCKGCGRTRNFSVGVPILKEFTAFREAHNYILEFKRLKGFP